MIRKERTRILVHCEKAFLKQWAEYFKQENEFHVIEEPKNALTMIRMRESAQNSLFYLGEVLVSETRVECKGIIGIGIIQGNELEKSYDLAILDAAFNAKLKGIEKLEKELLKQKKIQEEQHKKYVNQILKTRVNFETMDV